MPCPHLKRKKKKKNNPGKKKRPHTPITSKKQFKAMAAVRAAQEGRIDPGSLYGAAKEMYESMKKTGPKSPKAHMEEVKGKKYKRLPLKRKRKKKT